LKIKLNISLRPAILDDVKSLADLSHKTVLVKYPDIIGKDTVEGYVASGAVTQYYTDRHDYCCVAMLDDEPVGVYGLRGNTVDLMMVTLEHHRSGIGALLLGAAEKELFANHARITLESFRDNLQAVNFYKKHGWSVDEEYDDPEYAIPMVRLYKDKPIG